MITVHGADRPVLICWHEGQIFALDNRCPHMGFPLSKGSLDHGLLTCHWHHARFDLRSGCTFDLWADDTPMFEVCVQGDDVWVSKVPVQRADAVFHSARLRRGPGGEHRAGPGEKHCRVACGARGAEKCTGRSPNSVRDIIECGEMA